jgi:hypothetical protein
MESLDKAIECIYQSLLIVEEAKDQMMETLGLPAQDGSGATPSASTSTLDGRIDRLAGINTRMQDVQVDMVSVQGELDKI